MTLKSILCIFDGSPDELNALAAAMLLARSHGAQLRILHISTLPSLYAGIYFEGMTVNGEIISSIEKENEKRMKRAEQYAVAFAQKHQLALVPPGAPASAATARFIHIPGMADSVIAREGLLSDLIVIGRQSQPGQDHVASALFNTARPVLLVPAGEGEAYSCENRNVALAWNGRGPAARAAMSALPLLRQAEKLHVLMAHGHGEQPDAESAAKLLEYLDLHGLHAHITAVDRKHFTSGEILLTKAKALKCDLIVMGAYGHSLFREIVLGGVTEYLLKHADIPLLLSH